MRVKNLFGRSLAAALLALGAADASADAPPPTVVALALDPAADASLRNMRLLNATLNARGIIVEDAPLRAIVLPDRLRVAIESKLQMEQESQRMDFVLQKERQEAERKRIEAKGIADFQQIVSQGIDEKTLRWKGIEATVDLAKSENAKVVVVGSAKDGGLPLIMGSSK